MKKIVIIFLLIVTIHSISSSQSQTENGKENKNVTKIIVRPDTSYIELKRREILVIRNPVKRHEDSSSTGDSLKNGYKKKSDYRGMWSNFEFGFNNYQSQSGSFNLPQNALYLKLKPFKSYEFSWNIAKSSFN